MTAWIGKNHNTPTWEASAAGPFDRWANGLGFEYFYGFNAGDMNHWNPVLFENRNLVPASSDPNYHLTTDLADRAIAWTRKVKSIAPDRPFFLYVAPGATHSPHHAPADWIAKFKGKFDMGWDKYREETFERQKKLGVVPQDARLTARSAGLPAWDSLSADQKRLYARMMEVFAAYGAHCDFQMGRVVDAIKRMPGADNTLFIYIAGDNGASAEGASRARSTRTCSSTASSRNGRTTSTSSTSSEGRSTSITSRPPGPTRCPRRSSGPSRWPATSGARVTR